MFLRFIFVSLFIAPSAFADFSVQDLMRGTYKRLLLDYDSPQKGVLIKVIAKSSKDICLQRGANYFLTPEKTVVPSPYGELQSRFLISTELSGTSGKCESFVRETKSDVYIYAYRDGRDIWDYAIDIVELLSLDRTEELIYEEIPLPYEMPKGSKWVIDDSELYLVENVGTVDPLKGQPYWRQ